MHGYAFCGYATNPHHNDKITMSARGVMKPKLQFLYLAL